MVSERTRNRKIRTIIGKGITDSGLALSVQGWRAMVIEYQRIHEEILVNIMDVKLLKMNAGILLGKMNSDKYGDDIEKMQMFHRYEWIKKDLQELTI